MSEAQTVPKMPGWPYMKIATALSEFQAMFNRNPRALVVGETLWCILRATSTHDAVSFRVYGMIPVVLDYSGIVRGSDFIFTW